VAVKLCRGGAEELNVHDMATYPQDANSGILDQALIDVQVPHDTADGVGFQAKPVSRDARLVEQSQIVEL
jgi:hypothetical protein